MKKMYCYKLTVGLNDQHTKKQEIATDAAENMIADLLLKKFDIFAFTMIAAEGVYTHENGEIVREKSIRIEIASDKKIKTMPAIISALKESLNQESIMMETGKEKISFK